MKKTKTSYKMYPAWEFDREVVDLEELSKQGWQLKKGGCFHSKYYFDDTVQFRYALDFNQDISDPVRYRETFAEQGWEFVNSTFNGWHYFRKPYDPGLPEEEYQIYTDTASRQEMTGRWKRLAYTLGGIELVVGPANLLMNLRHPAIYSICLGLGCTLMGLLLVMSAKWIGQTDRRHSVIRSLAPVFALFLIALVFAIPHRSFETYTEYTSPDDDSAWTINIDHVRLPDLYTLELDVDAPADVTVCVVKEGESGGVIYQVTGRKLDQRAHMFLTPGFYYISTQYAPGTEPGLTGQFEYELD